MENIVDQLDQQTNDDMKAADERFQKQRGFVDEFEDDLRALEVYIAPVKNWLVRIGIDTANQCLDLNFSGDKHTLEGIFAALRRAGYIPSSRPKDEKLTDFSCWWDKDGQPFDKRRQLRLWVNFTSTACKRVKVGTKMVEQDVYEIVCE